MLVHCFFFLFFAAPDCCTHDNDKMFITFDFFSTAPCVTICTADGSRVRYLFDFRMMYFPTRP
jgi:hypothetical protein